MDRLNTYISQTEKIKYSDKDSASSAIKKSSMKSKIKKRKADKKKSRSHKKARRYSTSSSSTESYDSDGFEWVEKKTEDQTSSHSTGKPVNSEAQEKQLERDEWMNMESFLPCISKSDMRKEKLNTEEEAKKKMLLDKPGQSDKELNKYWKDGGNGLPQNCPGKRDNQPILDASWLKKSLRRAEEQALRDGRSLEEVAAERWGSLEAIQSMIAKAEKMPNGEHYGIYDGRHNSDRSNKDSLRASNSRTRSRSRSRERFGKYSTSNYSSQYTKRKCAYQRPKENDDYYQRNVNRSSGSDVKRWKKDKDDDRKAEAISVTSKSRETNAESNITEVKSIDVLSEAEMNKLGAKIIKAEIMGDEVLAAQLKLQLEQARKLTTVNNTSVQQEIVILTRTDAKGIARPIQPRSQSAQSTESCKKRKATETHISGNRVRHFADDDKYSLHEMFQREKGRSANEDEAVFAKLASKSMDHTDDMFEQHIARVDSEAKRDKQDRMYAIKEHKDLSKHMDNCWWCPDSKNMLKHMIVTMDSAICLSLPVCTSVTTGHCILTPTQHVACQLQLEKDVWERLKELKRKLTKMFMNENLYPIFFEVYKRRDRFSHMRLECIPLQKEVGELAPMYFKKALLECETEWSINKKIVDLQHKDIRHAVPNGMSYFMVEFASHPGYAHVIEDERSFPKNFAEEIIGGMLELDYNLWRKPKKQNFDDQREKMLEFMKMWEKYNSPQSEDTY